MNDQALLKINKFSFAYAVNETQDVLKDINLEIQPGSFNVFCGMSGSGKTTLLRHLKEPLKPKGREKGQIIFSEETDKNLKIAFVMQNPKNQIVMDSVWHELAFTLENLGLAATEIERRIAEISNFFGIEDWLDKSVSTLSGGEKQILNLASNLILQPDILILDEPTTQLDPIAKRDFLQMLFYTHQETGITILISEHNLNDLLERADQVVYLDQGAIGFTGPPRAFVKYLFKNNISYQRALPMPSRLYPYLNPNQEIPLSILEGRQFLRGQGEQFFQTNKNIFMTQEILKNELLLELDRLWYRYDREGDLVVKEANLNIYEREIFAILGGNGSGKSTLLYLISQALQPLRGKINIKSKARIAMLGQDPETIFSADSVEAVLREFQDRFANTEEEINNLIELFELKPLLTRHPYDLSGGEKQKLALAKVLLTKPDILLLDEPTNNLDYLNKEKIRDVLLELKKEMAILLVSHDLDFIAQTADRVAMLFNKKLLAQASTREFFKKNAYFTTSTYRLTRHIIDDCLVFEDLLEAMRTVE